MRKSNIRNEKVGSIAMPMIVFAFILSLLMGFLDVTMSAIYEPHGIRFFFYALAPITATITLVILLYITLGSILVFFFERFYEIKPIPLFISLAVYLGMFIRICSINCWLSFHLSTTSLFKLFLCFLISSASTIYVYSRTKKIIYIPHNKNYAVYLILIAIFVHAELFTYVWLHIFKLSNLVPLPWLVILILYAFVAMITFRLLSHSNMKFKESRIFAVIIFLSIMGHIFVAVGKVGFGGSNNTIVLGDHQIKRVIFISVDSLRADALSCYSEKGVHTPHINQLAQEAIIFRQAISSAPWTLEAVNSFITAVGTPVHQMTGIQSLLPNSIMTLAEHMAQANYYTAALGEQCWLTQESNISQGFFEYGIFGFSPVLERSFGSKILYKFFRLKNRWDSTTCITERFIHWLETKNIDDFFFWIHYLDPHIPYSPPHPFRPKGSPPPAIGWNLTVKKDEEIVRGDFVPSLEEKDWMKKLYDGEVAYVDDAIGKVINVLKNLGLYDEALIIFTSDHGEEFWDHGGFEHGHTLYNELLWVPLIIKLPHSLVQGEIDTVVWTGDLVPTVLDLCGIAYNDKYIRGHSLTHLWQQNEDPFERLPVISTGSHYGERKFSVIWDKWKCILHEPDNPGWNVGNVVEVCFEGPPAGVELYDLNSDPGEQHSIASEYPEHVEKAKEILRDYRKMVEDLREHYKITKESTERRQLKKDEIKKLKTLGYIK